MTNEAMRIAIAEACGWNYQKRETWPYRRPKQYEYILQSPTQELRVLPEFTVAHADHKTDHIIGIKRLPDYLNDLNAMHEAEKRLNDAQWKVYEALVSDATYQAIKGLNPRPKYFRPIAATAHQRAEAFLRTLGLWTSTP